eukprot:360702-Chlamydomonas_euryale.AAC.1
MRGGRLSVREGEEEPPMRGGRLSVRGGEEGAQRRFEEKWRKGGMHIPLPRPCQKQPHLLSTPLSAAPPSSQLPRPRWPGSCRSTRCRCGGCQHPAPPPPPHAAPGRPPAGMWRRLKACRRHVEACGGM